MSIGIVASHAVIGAADYDTQILALSPNFYWKMDEASFTNGQNLIDSSGNGRQLTLHGSGLSAQASLLTSGVGGSLALDGSSGTYGDIASASWLNPTSFTFIFLTYISASDTWHFNRWGGGSGQRDWVCIPVGWVSAWVGGSQRDVWLSSVSTGKHHCAYRVAYNGSTTTQTFFVDGVNVASRTDSGSINTNATSMLVGRDTSSGSASCRLSRVAHFGSALSDANITALAAAA